MGKGLLVEEGRWREFKSNTCEVILGGPRKCLWRICNSETGAWNLPKRRFSEPAVVRPPADGRPSRTPSVADNVRLLRLCIAQSRQGQTELLPNGTKQYPVRYIQC
jgi:hypothetical protein